MHSHHEQLSISLLRDDPEAFLRHCQPIIEICVHQYTASGMFPYTEAKDIMQSVNERLIKRLDSIARNYSGRVLLRTYLNVTIRNICLRLYEERNSAIKTIRIHEEHGNYSVDPTDAIAVDEELSRLHTVLHLFNTERHKIYLGMKLYLKIPLRNEDLVNWSARLGAADKKLLISSFGGNYSEMSMLGIFTTFAPVWNKIERSNARPQSIEWWANKNVNIIIKLMNGNPPRRSHSKETLQVLLSEEYSRHLNKEF